MRVLLLLNQKSISGGSISKDVFVQWVSDVQREVQNLKESKSKSEIFFHNPKESNPDFFNFIFPTKENKEGEEVCRCLKTRTPSFLQVSLSFQKARSFYIWKSFVLSWIIVKLLWKIWNEIDFSLGCSLVRTSHLNFYPTNKSEFHIPLFHQFGFRIRWWRHHFQGWWRHMEEKQVSNLKNYKMAFL